MARPKKTPSRLSAQAGSKIVSKTYTHKHKGYELRQTEYNWHYMIVDLATNKTVMHVPARRKLTEDEAKQHIEDFLQLRDNLL